MKTRCLLVTGIEQIQPGETEVPSPGPGQLLVAIELSAVSPGTEIRCFQGKEGGSTEYPFIPGYSCMGRVIERGAGCTLGVGTRVFAGNTLTAAHRCQWGGHIGHALIDESNALPVPESVDPRSVALISLAAIAHRGYALTPTGPLDTVAVLGLGPIGMLSALIHRAHGARVVALDVLSSRLELARSLGLEACSPESAEAKKLLPDGANLVVDSTGVPAVLRKALAWLAELPWNLEKNAARTLVLQGSYGNGDIQLPYNDAFFKELRLVVPRNQLPSDRAAVLNLLTSGKLNIAPLCSRVEKPDKAQAMYEALRDRDPSILTVAFDWS